MQIRVAPLIEPQPVAPWKRNDLKLDCAPTGGSKHTEHNLRITTKHRNLEFITTSCFVITPGRPSRSGCLSRNFAIFDNDDQCILNHICYISCSRPKPLKTQRFYQLSPVGGCATLPRAMEVECNFELDLRTGELRREAYESDYKSSDFVSFKFF